MAEGYKQPKGAKYAMQTPYDWLTMAIFAGLVVLLLQRSSMDDPPDQLWQYLPPAIGCAVANQLGNNGYTAFAVVGIGAVLAYIYYILKPRFGR